MLVMTMMGRFLRRDQYLLGLCVVDGATASPGKILRALEADVVCKGSTFAARALVPDSTGMMIQDAADQVSAQYGVHAGS